MVYTYVEQRSALQGRRRSADRLLVWPQTDDARDYLTEAGTRRRLTSLAASSEVDNPYFNVEKNAINAKNNRIIANLGLTFTPFSWGSLKTNIGADSYTNQNQLLRHPESAAGARSTASSIVANDITRNINAQTLFNVNSVALTRDLSISGLVGNAISDFKSTTDAPEGPGFPGPELRLRQQHAPSDEPHHDRAAPPGQPLRQATLDYKRLPVRHRHRPERLDLDDPDGAELVLLSLVSTSFIFSDAFPSIGQIMTGKLRAAYAEVGKDARPYAYRPSLEYKTTSYGGYGYGFTGPNLDLKPEFARSYEFGTELGFFDDRLGLDATVYRKQTEDQIVNDIRGSYGTGFILFNLNGAETRNQGVEVTLARHADPERRTSRGTSRELRGRPRQGPRAA